ACPMQVLSELLRSVVPVAPHLLCGRDAAVCLLYYASLVSQYRDHATNADASTYWQEVAQGYVESPIQCALDSAQVHKKQESAGLKPFEHLGDHSRWMGHCVERINTEHAIQRLLV